jgi:hypothetical protein
MLRRDASSAGLFTMAMVVNRPLFNRLYTTGQHHFDRVVEIVNAGGDQAGLGLGLGNNRPFSDRRAGLN